MEVVVEPEGQVHHDLAFGDNFGAAAKTGEEMADIAVVLLDEEGQVLAGEELVLGDQAVVAVPVIGNECPSLDADFVEQFLACRVITASQNPGDGSASNRVIGPPNP